MTSIEYNNVKIEGSQWPVYKSNYKGGAPEPRTLLKRASMQEPGVKRTKVHFQPSEPLVDFLIVSHKNKPGNVNHFTECFFDTPKHHLLHKGWWLRNINDSWTLKRHCRGTPDGVVEYYEETNEHKIIKYLGEILGNCGTSIYDYCPTTLAAFATTRLSFNIDDGRIYLDCVQTSSSSYFLVGTAESSRGSAKDRVNFPVNPSPSKILFYLSQIKHFNFPSPVQHTPIQILESDILLPYTTNTKEVVLNYDNENYIQTLVFIKTIISLISHT